MNPTIFKNPDIKISQEFADKFGLDFEILTKLIAANKRVEFVDDVKFCFGIIYISEYNKISKSVNQFEVDIYYDKQHNQSYFFAFNTEYFFDKYFDYFKQLRYNNWGELMYRILGLVFEDETKLIEHILDDTNSIKSEYYTKTAPDVLIRHLTNNQINISSLKLILANQNKAVDIISGYIPLGEKAHLNYQKNSISDELIYAQEFCKTLMDSINTKFEVRSSRDIYTWTKYTFVAIIGTFIFDVLTIFIDHSDSPFFAWVIGVVLTIFLLLFTLQNFKKD